MVLNVKTGPTVLQNKIILNQWKVNKPNQIKKENKTYMYGITWSVGP